MTRKLPALRIVGAAFALLAGTLAAASCQMILGEVEIVDRNIGLQDPDAGLEPHECEAGDLRCAGALRQLCTELAPGRGAQWVVQEDCVTAALCSRGLSQSVSGCQRKTCDFDSVRCDGAVPQRCNTELTGWNAAGEACPNAGECSTEPLDCPNGTPCCRQGGCTPGSLRCNQNVLQRCRPDQKDWDVLDECATPQLCERGFAACGSEPAPCACAAKVCDPGETRCTDGTTLEACNDAQDGWQYVDSCATIALCELGRTLAPLHCEPPKCNTAIDEHRCTEAGVLQRCRENRTGFDDVALCPGGAAFCNAAEQRCEQTPCAPGDQRCNGAAIEVCRGNRSGFDASGVECANSVLCKNTPAPPHCDAPACAADLFSCDGRQLQRCNDDRTGMIPVGLPCQRADLCSADRRRCDFCVPSRRECNPRVSASRTCNAAGTAFGDDTPCPGGCIPETGECRTCTVGQYICQNGNLARCNDGQVFTALNRAANCEGAVRVTCTNGDVVRTGCGSLGCNTGRNDCNECGGSDRRCAPNQAASFQVCGGQGTFGQPQACPADFACEGPGDCRCSAGDTRCEGNSVFACSAERTAFVSAQGCGTDFTCADPGGCRCTPGFVHCEGNALRACNGAGTAFENIDACAGRLLRSCQGGSLATDPCQSAEHCAARIGNTCAACIVSDPEDCEVDERCNPDTGQCELVPPPPDPEFTP